MEVCVAIEEVGNDDFLSLSENLLAHNIIKMGEKKKIINRTIYLWGRGVKDKVVEVVGKREMSIFYSNIKTGFTSRKQVYYPEFIFSRFVRRIRMLMFNSEPDRRIASRRRRGVRHSSDESKIPITHGQPRCNNTIIHLPIQVRFYLRSRCEYHH